MDLAALHPSVRHYHTPLPMAHRNTRAFATPPQSEQKRSIFDPSVPDRSESNRLWIEGKYLRFGVHHAHNSPYLDRSEWPDPVRLTTPAIDVPCGYTTLDAKVRDRGGRGKGPQLKPGEFDHPQGSKKTRSWHKIQGFRPAPAHACAYPEKVNWHDPFHPPPRERTEVPLVRMPGTPLLQEVDDRLQACGCPSLAEVRFAATEAIAELLESCGFGPQHRMVILWELRRAFPLEGGAAVSTPR